MFIGQKMDDLQKACVLELNCKVRIPESLCIVVEAAHVFIVLVEHLIESFFLFLI